MAVSVKILNLRIISPLVGHIHSRHDGATIGIFAAIFEELSVQCLIEVIHRIIKGEEYHLRSIFGKVPAWNVFTTAIAVWNSANFWVAFGSFGVDWRLGTHGCRSFRNG